MVLLQASDSDGGVMTEGRHEAVRTDDQVVAAAEARELKRQIRDLERLLGKKTLENEILREAWALAKSKTVVARTRAAGGACDEVQVPHG
jgi:hypothetical protein